MLITVYEHSIINVGKERTDNQVSYEDRDLLLKKEFKDTKQNFSEKRYFQKKNIFEWNSSSTIKTSSIVGTLKIDDELTIEILPKIFNNNESKKIARKNLIRLVEITEYEDIWDNETEVEEDAENIPYLEFIILRFTTKLLDELQKGIYAEYVNRVEESSFVRGAIQPHLQDMFDKSKIVCKFQELSFDNKLMQIFKTVSEHFLKNSMFSYEIKQNLFEITSILSNVQSLNKLEIFDFENYYFTRLNETYEILFYQAKIIYFEYFPLNSDDDESTPYWAIYFDMDFLFEKFIRHLLSKSGFDVKEQEKLQIYKTNYVTPDFVLYNEKIVIDSKYTKYKEFGKNKSPNSQSIFQITNYMDNLGFEGSLVMIGNANENMQFDNLRYGKSFNVISLDMRSDFENIIDNFRFFNDNNKLNFKFLELEFLPDDEEDNSNRNSNDYKIAKEYLRKKEYSKAINILKNLTQTKKNLNDIGVIYFQLKEYDNSIKYLKESISLEANCYAYDYLGRSYHFGKKDYDKAIGYYTNAINLIKNNKCNHNNSKRTSYFYNNRGYSYRNNSEYSNAIIDFKKAIRLNEDLSDKLLSEISKLEQYA